MNDEKDRLEAEKQLQRKIQQEKKRQEEAEKRR